mmetsp:Transcript_25290/g.100810  ORF Transcript_25290/g.100810 Transcript_25290/m.100810 type:complete len:244 (-) Transcript_25290:2242-2973(-)
MVDLDDRSMETLLSGRRRDRSTRFLVLACVVVLGTILVFNARSGVASSHETLSASTAARPGIPAAATAVASAAVVSPTTTPECIATQRCADPAAGPAVAGYDVVAFFGSTLRQGVDCGVRGTREHAARYGNYTFLFASSANRDAFLAAPETYVPAYGGFCAWGVATEAAWSPDFLGPPIVAPGSADCERAWVVDDAGRLFLLNRYAMSLWLSDVASYRAAADATWRTWYPALDDGVLNTGSFA